MSLNPQFLNLGGGEMKPKTVVFFYLYFWAVLET